MIKFVAFVILLLFHLWLTLAYTYWSLSVDLCGKLSLLYSCSVLISFSTWRTWIERDYELREVSEPSQNVLGRFNLFSTCCFCSWCKFCTEFLQNFLPVIEHIISSVLFLFDLFVAVFCYSVLQLIFFWWLQFLNFLLNDKNIQTWMKDEWNRLYDSEFVQSSILQPLLK